MAKFVCSVCGYIHEDLTAPENCPICMASASEFSEVEQVPPTENEPAEDSVEDEAQQIIETYDAKTDESLNESDTDCLESNEFIKPISDNAKSDNQNINSNVVGDIDVDEEAILKEYQEHPGAKLQLIKWYTDTYHVGVKEAKERVDFVLDKHGLLSADKSGTGCMVTVLIAISSTLSMFFMS